MDLRSETCKVAISFTASAANGGNGGDDKIPIKTANQAHGVTT